MEIETNFSLIMFFVGIHLNTQRKRKIIYILFFSFPTLSSWVIISRIHEKTKKNLLSFNRVLFETKIKFLFKTTEKIFQGHTYPTSLLLLKNIKSHISKHGCRAESKRFENYKTKYTRNDFCSLKITLTAGEMKTVT